MSVIDVPERLERDGFAMLGGVFDEVGLSSLEAGLKAAAARVVLKKSRGEAYAARNAARGDVLVMRPLLAHRSSRSRPGCRSRRRVIHLEWAPKAAPMAGLEWHDFEPL